MQTEATSYAEQFQGLYTLCQMVAVVLVLAGCYYLGWGTSIWLPGSTGVVLLLVAAAAV
ncbi:MAG: hypothetical protein HYU37_06765 [Acidobacteria bacterium]|nr:hypothetical protein [Acidobacteriota bacterium]